MFSNSSHLIRTVAALSVVLAWAITACMDPVPLSQERYACRDDSDCVSGTCVVDATKGYGVCTRTEELDVQDVELDPTPDTIEDTALSDEDAGPEADTQLLDTAPVDVNDELDTNPSDLEDEPIEDVTPVCEDPIVLQFAASELVLDLWQLENDGDEGEVARPNNLNPGDARLEVDVPCSDTWHVWVRGHNDGSEDSFFLAVDGQPDPPLIFELDCAPDGPAGYVWAELNQRERNAEVCVRVTDPWVQDWSAGPHTIVFTPRESRALSRIVVTNDDTWAP